MGIRLSGLTSGLDTESIIKELMTAQSLKKVKIEQKKTKLEWKQEKWKDLNTKIYKLYSEQLSKLRFQKNYSTKKVTSSNESILKATADSNASLGSHEIEVQKLASTQYVTGGQINNLKSSSKLAELSSIDGTVDQFAVGNIITVTSGSGSKQVVKNLEITADTKVSDLVTTLQNAGLNASFDEAQGRFIIGGKNSGQENDFTIEYKTMAPGNATAIETERGKLETLLGNNASSLNSFYSNYRDALNILKEKQTAYDGMGNGDGKLTAWEELQRAKEKVQSLEDNIVNLAIDAEKQQYTNGLVNNKYNNIMNKVGVDNRQIYDAVKKAVDEAYYKLDVNGIPLVPNDYTDDVKKAATSHIESTYRSKATKIIEDNIKNGTIYADSAAKQAAIEAEYNRQLSNDGGKNQLVKNYCDKSYQDSLEGGVRSAASSFVSGDAASQAQIENHMSSVTGSITSNTKTVLADYKTLINSNTGNVATETTNAMKNIGLCNISRGSDNKVTASSTNVSFTSAADAEIIMDGAALKGSSNSFEFAGITLDLVGAAPGQKVSISVTNDMQKSYDMVKNFLNSYNTLLYEMNEIYGADRAKGYEPLTEEEKTAMSDKQVELWENKIKNSLLRRDDTLSSIRSSMRSSLQTSVEVDGKKYSLSSLGIRTGDWTEDGMLHIYGDSDDPDYSDETNVFMETLNKDPDLVAKVLSGISQNLYTTLQDKMKSTTLSSALTFYNDKQMKKEVTDYGKSIKTWEKRLADMETKYYKQFTAMEKAMAQLNSQGSSLSGLFG